jgi:hypothetical protein
MPRHKPQKGNLIDNIVERMNLKTVKDSITGCWLWMGGNTRGHGKIRFNYCKEMVHRISAHLYLGYDLDSSLQVNHKRECPNKNCWNPDHLYIGTQKENRSDYLNKLKQTRIKDLNEQRAKENGQETSNEPTKID